MPAVPNPVRELIQPGFFSQRRFRLPLLLIRQIKIIEFTHRKRRLDLLFQFRSKLFLMIDFAQDEFLAFQNEVPTFFCFQNRLYGHFVEIARLFLSITSYKRDGRPFGGEPQNCLDTLGRNRCFRQSGRVICLKPGFKVHGRRMPSPHKHGKRALMAGFRSCSQFGKHQEDRKCSEQPAGR